MRDITRTQLCTKEVSGHNLNQFKVTQCVSLFSVLLTHLMSFCSLLYLCFQVAEFSECSKTNGFSFVLHCRKAKDDMVLFSLHIITITIIIVNFCHLRHFQLSTFLASLILCISHVFSSSGVLSKSLDGQTRVCSGRHRGIPQ